MGVSRNEEKRDGPNFVGGTACPETDIRLSSILKIKDQQGIPIMRRVMIAALLCASSAVPVMAQAQDGDVLVMRRAIAQPTGKVTIPPSPDFVRVPLKVKDSGVTTYALNGTLKLEIEEVGCRITDGSIIIDEATCAIGQGPQVGDIINFTAKMDPDLKAYYVPREQYEEILPAFSQQAIDALCSGSALVSGSAFSGSCDPEAVVNTYAKFINALDDPISRSMPQNVSSSDVLNFYVSSVGCYSTQTGSVVSPSTCANITKSPAEIHAIPATYIPQLREVFLDTADIDSMSPAPAIILKKNLSTFCTSTDPKIRVDNQDWVVRCGEPDDPSDYKRTVVTFNDPMMFGSMTDRIPNNSTSGEFRMVVQSTGCLDQSGNEVTGKCDFLTSGPNIYDIVTIPATYIPNLREIYVNQADLVAAAGQDNPVIVTRRIADACTGKYTKIKVIHEGVASDWSFNCGEPDDSSDYKRTVVKFNDPMMFGPMTNRIPNNSSSGEFRMVVQSTGCLDQSGNEVTGKCDYLPEGPSLYDQVTVPAVYVTDLRELYVDRNDIEAAAGNFGPYASTRPIMGNKTLTDACNGNGFNVQVMGEGSSNEWTFHCGMADDPANYTRTARQLFDPVNFGSERTPNDPDSGVLRMVVRAIGCLDKADNEVLGKCNYLPDGPDVYDFLSVPATYVPELRKVYIDRADIETMAVNPNPLIVNYALADACVNGKISFRADGMDWGFRCGAAEDPDNFEMKAQALRDPRDYGSARNTNMDPNATKLGLAVASTVCLDKSTNSTTDTSTCAYLPGRVSAQDILWMPAVFDASAKTITIDPEAFRALGHETSLDYNHNSIMCGRNITIDVNYQDFKVLCSS